MNCLEFRRQVGAEPNADHPDLVSHGQACASCARHQQELQAMDALLLRALKVEAPAKLRPGNVRPVPKRRWLAIAASLVGGLAIGLTLWLAEPRPSLAHEVFGHVHQELGAFRSVTPMDEARIAKVLAPNGVRLRPGLGLVTFAERCLFEGKVVPHLVVRTESGPVTVLLLTHREVSEPVRLFDPDFVGVVLPAPRGSIAIIGEGQLALDDIARQVSEAVEWGN